MRGSECALSGSGSDPGSLGRDATAGTPLPDPSEPHAHLRDLIRRLPALAPCEEAIGAAHAMLAACFRRGNTLLLCGNGGSAADCEHLAGELLKGFALTRPLSASDRERLPEPLASRLQEGLPAIPLPSLMSANTAFANDVDPQMTFAQGVWALGRPGDVLLGISTSGNAANVCHAIEAAHGRSMETLALTGAEGGRLAGLATHAIRAPETDCDRVQELHLPIYHCLARMLEETFFG